ncbi:hypothetical protein MCHUDSM44219_00294 [Mycolicibacterium chubuense]|uniref:Uncharacterized protein n=1 Tax=Mycolicibacterium chubuense TaxID=1800 RepID=A0A0J6WN28_MYCCU|nr:hypothetical protein MCHUDSM44219_00294 [Mycolicibacterium chubuense]SPX95199.1 putative homoserine kinase type II (protein kinase fold) [Mycolicibacterium chubuense]
MSVGDVLVHLGRGARRIGTDAVAGRWRPLPRRKLAYTLVTGMAPEDRRNAERDLLDLYRRALAAGGGPDLDRDDLWERYRQGALYPYVAALTTAGLGGMQAEDVAMRGLEHALAALEDLDTVAALRRSL